MAKKPKIRITVVDRKGPCGCHHGHRIGDSFDFDTERGKLCSMAMHVAFPYIDIMRYGGTPPTSRTRKGEVCFSCPDVDVLNIFRLEIVDDKAAADNQGTVGNGTVGSGTVGNQGAESAQMAAPIATFSAQEATGECSACGSAPVSSKAD